MLTFMHVHANARRLARAVRQSMADESDDWAIDADRQGRPVLSKAHFRIAVVPRRLRLFDTIHLFCDEVEVWLPLMARLRLRTAARWLVVRFAQQEWTTPSAEVCRVPVRGLEEPV